MNPFSLIFGPVIDTVGNLVGKWMDKKKIQAQGKVDIARAKTEGEVRRLQTIQEQMGTYNIEAQKGMQASWKDELFVIVWLAAFVGMFVPWTQPYIKEGFIFLKGNTPWWYEYCLVGMVVASFGLKGWKFFKMNGKNGG